MENRTALEETMIIVKIAKVLLKQEVSTWVWEVVTPALRGKYLKQAREIYKMLLSEGIIK